MCVRSPSCPPRAPEAGPGPCGLSRRRRQPAKKILGNSCRAEGALSSACHVTDYSPLILECPAGIDFAGAARGEIWTYCHHRNGLKIKLEPLGGWY